MKTKRILAVLAATTVLFAGGVQVASADEATQVPTVTIDLSNDTYQATELTQSKAFVFFEQF